MSFYWEDFCPVKIHGEKWVNAKNKLQEELKQKHLYENLLIHKLLFYV